MQTAEASSHSPSVGKQEFLLGESHTFRLVCDKCLQPNKTDPKRFYRVNVQVGHKCKEDMLVVARKNQPKTLWITIRERYHHVNFMGKYVLCNNFTATPQKPCAVKDIFNCWFPHSWEEQVFWNKEKVGLFSISDFMRQNKVGQIDKGAAPDLEGFNRKHPGNLSFSADGKLVHVSEQMRDNPPFTCKKKSDFHKTVVSEIRLVQNKDFSLCPNQKFCYKPGCLKVHSEVERSFWRLEVQTAWSPQVLVQHLNDLANGCTPVVQFLQPTSKPQQAVAVTQQTSAELGQPKFVKLENKLTSETRVKHAIKEGECPFSLKFVCGVCFKGKKSCQVVADKTGKNCAGRYSPHDWQSNHIMIICSKGKKALEIRPLPNIAKTKTNQFKHIPCEHVKKKGTCYFVGKTGEPCHYSHSEEEGHVWEWQSKHQG